MEREIILENRSKGLRVSCRRVLFFSALALSSLASEAHAGTAESFLEGFSRHVAASLKKSARTSLSAPLSTGPCQITAGAPDYGLWRATQADIDSDYVLLHYNYEAAPANLPRNILFVWKRDGSYAPWLVYYGSEKILDAHVNAYGGVAFFRSPPNGSAQAGPDDLLFCPQDPSPQALNNQLTAYACAQDPTQAVLVDQILHNQAAPILGGTAPDGKFYDLDWANDRLIYTRSQRTTNLATLNNWDSLLRTNSVIDQIFYSQWTQNDMWLTAVDRTGSIGYVIINLNNIFSPSSSAFIEYRGAFPQTPGQFNQFVTLSSVSTNAYYHRETPFGTGFFSVATNNFVSMGTERQGLFRLRPAPATPTTPAILSGDLYARSSVDGFSQDHLVAQAPNSNATLLKPTRLNFPTLGETLVVQSSTGSASRIELYLYTPAVAAAGTYMHVQTIDPILGYPNLAIHTATDSLPNAAFLGIQFTANQSDGQVVLIECQ